MTPKQKLVAELLYQQLDECWYCGCTDADVWHLDHKTPRSRGGSDDRTNLVAACAPCNQRKGSQDYDWFIINDAACLANEGMRSEIAAARGRVEKRIVSVQPFDVRGIYGKEWNLLGKALQEFAEHDGNRPEPITRTEFLEYIAMCGAALRLLDHCNECWDENCDDTTYWPWIGNVTIPHAVERTPKGGFLAFYECPHCGARWKCSQGEDW